MQVDTYSNVRLSGSVLIVTQAILNITPSQIIGEVFRYIYMILSAQGFFEWWKKMWDKINFGVVRLVLQNST
jgi:hypothetical protein